MQQQPVTVIAQNPQQNDDKLRPSSVSQLNGLSITQLVMGILCIIFGVVLLALDISGDGSEGSGIGVIGYGIYTGIYFVVVGGIGMGAAKNNTNCWITACMILNIFCTTLWCFPFFMLTIIGLILTSDNACQDTFFGIDFGFCGSEAITNTFHALDSLMLLMSIIEFVITIWSATLCCGAICRCCKRHTVGHVVHYNAQYNVVPSQQIAMYPSVPATTYTSYPATQQGYTTHGGYPVGVHQQPFGGYAATPQGPPNYYLPPMQQMPPVGYNQQAAVYPPSMDMGESKQ